MTEHHPHMSPSAGDDTGAAPGALPRRVAMGVALMLLAVILVVAARSDSAPGSERIGRRLELMELIDQEQARTQALAARVDELSTQVAAYEATSGQGRAEIAALQENLDAVAVAAGLTGVRGNGLTVTLTDSRLAYSPEYDPNDLVIHEQDLQAVINALWSGGAEAVSVNGQRVLATTAIRCVGNTLLLHGALHPPPYVIAAIGDPQALHDALDRDPAMQAFAAAVETYQLGFKVLDSEELELLPYEGSTTLGVARPSGTVE